MADTRTHAVNEFRAVFWELRDAWLAAPLPQPVFTGHEASDYTGVTALQVAYGWAASSLRSGEAALLLVDAGFAHEATPLVRLVIENAIALHWLEDMRDDAVQQLFRMRSRSAARVRDAQAHGWQMKPYATDGIDEALAVITDEHVKSLDVFEQVKHRALAYGLGEPYQRWLIRTWASHPSIMSATPFARRLRDHDDDGNPPERVLGTFSRVPELDPIPVEPEVCLAVASALRQYDRFLPEPQFVSMFAGWRWGADPTRKFIATAIHGER